MFYWGSFTGIDLSLTKTRRTRSADCRDGKLYITRIRASLYLAVRETELRFYGISHACANSGAQAVFSLPRKKRPGNV